MTAQGRVSWHILVALREESDAIKGRLFILGTLSEYLFRDILRVYDLNTVEGCVECVSKSEILQKSNAPCQATEDSRALSRGRCRETHMLPPYPTLTPSP